MPKKKPGRKRKNTPRTKKDLERRERSLYEALEFESKRKKRSRVMDESKTSKIVHNVPVQKWFKNPSGSDVFGVDTKKYQAKNAKEAIMYLQASTKPYLESKHIIFNKENEMRAKIKQDGTSESRLQKVISIRYNNVRIKKRTKKGIYDEYFVSVLKRPI